MLAAQRGEELPLRIIIGGVAGAVLVILLVLGLYLFLRTSRKSQKSEAPEGMKVEANKGHIRNDGPENYYYNVSAIAGSSRNGTAGTQLSEMKLEDLYSKPKEPNEVDYVLVDHAAINKAPQAQKHTEETEYSVVTS
ncbi:hypothetical protein XELAEV_18036588mg [Xenopus laevis]|uniref:Uncharacterized protein n=1 Tax=Xenopus laevis TaxID=8355 RepID=A0A974HD49_XENLA|nr:hypothetical protein XELAEV_18036588mg [Xenopus laevis]